MAPWSIKIVAITLFAFFIAHYYTIGMLVKFSAGIPLLAAIVAPFIVYFITYQSRKNDKENYKTTVELTAAAGATAAFISCLLVIDPLKQGGVPISLAILLPLITIAGVVWYIHIHEINE